MAAQNGQEEVTSGVDASERPTSASSSWVEDEQANQDGRRQKRKRDSKETRTTRCEFGTHTGGRNRSSFYAPIVLYILK